MFLITTSPAIISEIIMGLWPYLIVLMSTCPKNISRTTMPPFRSHLPKVVKNGKPVFSPKTGPRHRKAKLYRYWIQKRHYCICIMHTVQCTVQCEFEKFNTANVKAVFLFKELMDVKICRKLTKKYKPAWFPATKILVLRLKNLTISRS